MEQSTFEMSGVESSVMGEIPQKKEDEKNRNALIILAIVCLGVFSMAAVGAAAFSTSTPPGSTTEGDEVPYVDVRGGPTGRPIEPRKPSEFSASGSTTEKTTPRVRKNATRPDPESLLCTFGLSTNQSTMFPADGMCDYFFFDSAYANGKNTLATGSDTFEPNLMRFLSEVSNYAKTQFGVAFAYYSRNSVVDDLKQRNPTRLEVFWKKNVYHFGVIDVPVFGTFDDTGLLRCLKVLADLARTHSDYGRPAYVVVGAAVHSKNLVSTFRQLLSEYQPDLLISFGHYPYGDHERKNCYSMPPTALHRPFHAHGYPYDLVTAAETIENLKPADSNATSWLTSVSMKGRWTVKLPHTGNQGIMSPCKQNTSMRYFGVYTEICNNPAFVPYLKYDDYNAAMWTFDQKTSMFIYDNERSLCQKLCLDKANHTSIRFGIAVFDLDYEDSSNQCSRQNQFPGGFSRLKTLRKIVDYFKGFTSEQQKDGCLHLVSTE